MYLILPQMYFRVNLKKTNVMLFSYMDIIYWT